MAATPFSGSPGWGGPGVQWGGASRAGGRPSAHCACAAPTRCARGGAGRAGVRSARMRRTPGAPRLLGSGHYLGERLPGGRHWLERPRSVEEARSGVGCAASSPWVPQLPSWRRRWAASHRRRPSSRSFAEARAPAAPERPVRVRGEGLPAPARQPPPTPNGRSRRAEPGQPGGAAHGVLRWAWARAVRGAPRPAAAIAASVRSCGRLRRAQHPR